MKKLRRRKKPRSDSGFCLILTAVAEGEAADKLAESLLRRRLCACVSRVPGVFSRYRWQGREERAREALLIIKTRSDFYPRVESFLADHHPYDCPEILKIPVTDGFAPYLRWLITETEPIT